MRSNRDIPRSSRPAANPLVRMSRSESTSARSPTRTAAAVPNASGSAPAGASFANRTWVDGTPALVVAVHQVVVHDGGRVEELERSAHPDDRIAPRPAGRRERPEADRRSHALAAGLEEPEELVHERRGRRIHAGELRAAVAEEPAERAVDRWTDAFERGR